MTCNEELLAGRSDGQLPDDLKIPFLHLLEGLKLLEFRSGILFGRVLRTILTGRPMFETAIIVQHLVLVAFILNIKNQDRLSGIPDSVDRHMRLFLVGFDRGIIDAGFAEKNDKDDENKREEVPAGTAH